MRHILLFAALPALAWGAWLGIEHSVAAAPAETGGPFLAEIGPCTFPQPSEEAALVLAGYYNGAAISTVRLEADNPQEEATTAVDVRIAPGFKPLYLVVAGARNSVLRVGGWTSRIERLVVVTQKSYPVGVTGVPRSKLSFVEDCALPPAALYRSQPTLAGWLLGSRRAAQETPEPPHLPGLRAPDVVGGGYDPAVLTIGADAIGAKIYATHDQDSRLPEWQRRYADFEPAGIYDIDPGSLVAPVPATRYEQLPGWMGLAQLVRDGKLERMDSDNFRVRGLFRVPAGLFGSQAVTFVVPHDQPDPAGDLAHSKIYRE